MWHVWQVGAAASSGSVPFCFRRCRTPCFDDEYISHCGWSMPMWQVRHACGSRASATENRWRVWQASHDARPNVAPSSRSCRMSSSDLRPTRWHPPQPCMPSVRAIGSQWVVGIAFMLAHARACLPPVNCSAWIG